MKNHLCDYGCGKPGIYQFKNGKWCCNINHRKCKCIGNKIGTSKTGKKRKPHTLETIKKIKESNTGKKRSEETKEKMKVSNNSFEKRQKCSEMMTKKWEDQKFRNRMTGENNPFYGKHHSKESNTRNRENNIGKHRHSEEFKDARKQKMLSGQSSHMNSIPRDPEKMKRKREKDKQYMINGGRKYACSFIKKISKEEIKLREIVKELYPDCIFQYTILNYDLDVALINEKIAIEWDGYYHFNTEENKQYHKFRQEKIEAEGWKFLRYTMFDKFPNKEQVKESIEKLI